MAAAPHPTLRGVSVRRTAACSSAPPPHIRSPAPSGPPFPPKSRPLYRLSVAAAGSSAIPISSRAQRRSSASIIAATAEAGGEELGAGQDGGGREKGDEKGRENERGGERKWRRGEEGGVMGNVGLRGGA